MFGLGSKSKSKQVQLPHVMKVYQLSQSGRDTTAYIRKHRKQLDREMGRINDVMTGNTGNANWYAIRRELWRLIELDERGGSGSPIRRGSR